jgi:hypothetical protein
MDKGQQLAELNKNWEKLKEERTRVKDTSDIASQAYREGIRRELIQTESIFTAAQLSTLLK